MEIIPTATYNISGEAIRETGKIKFKKLGAKYSYSYNSLEKFMNG